jgi:hypothetical protein
VANECYVFLAQRGADCLLGRRKYLQNVEQENCKADAPGLSTMNASAVMWGAKGESDVQDQGRDHRRRQLRFVAGAGRPLLPRRIAAGDFVPGLMHVDLGGYHPRDIEFTAAFDVSAHKVGLDLGEAIFAEPNNTIRFAEVPHSA